MLKPINVHIQGYQSIDDLEFEIRGFTALSGKTNIGKSAIVRAISSAILNNPVVGMVRNGSTYSSVSLSTEDWSFKWEKSERGINRYEIGGKVLDKVGSKQLQEISDLGFKSVKIGQDEINPWLASQFSPIFLLDRSGPQVTDFISEISRLNVLQDAVVLAARGKKKSNDEASLKLNESNLFRQKQKSVSAIKDIESLYQDLEDQAASIDQYELKINKLTKLTNSIKQLSVSVSRLKPVDSVLIPTELDQKLIDRYQKAIKLNNTLIFLAKKVISAKNASNTKIPVIPQEIKTLQTLKKYAWIPVEIEEIKKLEKISKVQIPNSSDIEIDKLILMKKHEIKLKKAVKDIGLIKQVSLPNQVSNDDILKLDKLKKMRGKIEELKKSVHEASIPIENIEKRLKEVNDKIAIIPKCPTCNRPKAIDEC